MDYNPPKKDTGILEKKEEDKSFYAGLKRNVREFLTNSTLHGLKYIADDTITLFERSFFGLSFVFVIICSFIFITNIYTKWSASPIIITTSPKPTFTTTIPFPAVTICNSNKALKSRVDELGDSKPRINRTLLMSLCAKDNDFDERGDQLTWKNFKYLLLGVAQPCNSMIVYCQFGSIPENCGNIFNPVLTDDGLCCTFNSVDPSFLLRNYTDDVRFNTNSQEYVPIDWTPETGFGRDLPPEFYPRVSAGTGSQMGLTVILNASSSEYYCSNSRSIGFKVLVHNPAEQPKISGFGFLVTSGRETRVSIDPQYQTAVPAIRSISTKIRQCLFSDEGNLNFYRTYSRKNCELECEAHILAEQCHCVPYYLPRVDEDSRICGPKDNHCTQPIQYEIASSNGNFTCDTCLPACFELSYNPTVTSTKMVAKPFLTSDDYPSKLFDHMEDVSIVNFYYLTNMFQSTTKGEMFGFTEFLSNTGGLLGLFMGFSVFSIIEILYFIILRPFCAHRVRIRQQRRANLLGVNKKNVWMTPVKGRKPIRKNNLDKMWTAGGHQWRVKLFAQRFDSRMDKMYPYLE